MRDSRDTLQRAIVIKTITSVFMLVVAFLGMLQQFAFAQKPVPPVSNPCPRFSPGSEVQDPPALYSDGGVLNVNFSYQQTTDSNGNLLHCFMTPDGTEEPTLYVNPGDTLNVAVTNNTPAQPFGETFNPPNCGDTTVQFPPPPPPNPNGIASIGSSVNIHYHGTNVTPQCGGDNVTKTLINSDSHFQYSFTFPNDEPPGLYWYHPHVHGLAERDLLGGASAALVVNGIEQIQPAVDGLRERVLVIRDQPTIYGAANESQGNCGNGIPFQDISVNYVPIPAQKQQNGTVTFTPAVLRMEKGETEFWRVTNSTADTILDLQVLYDGVAQTLQIVAIDGVPVNSQDGHRQGQLIPLTEFRLPVASRVEFLVTAPAPTVQVAQLITNNINTGPQGDCDPTRPIFNIVLDDEQKKEGERIAHHNLGDTTAFRLSHQRFGGLVKRDDQVKRVLQFTEIQPTQFFITVAGQQPLLFDNNNPPAIITTQGSVEQWTIQNLAQENHEFHMHQIHFKVLSQNNFEINGATQAPGILNQFLDMVEVPFWDNVKNPNQSQAPNVQLLMDFRGMDIGDFVYHCHILSHEDLGMMAIIRVQQGH